MYELHNIRMVGIAKDFMSYPYRGGISNVPDIWALTNGLIMNTTEENKNCMITML
jgi:hypothetical protein